MLFTYFPGQFDAFKYIGSYILSDLEYHASRMLLRRNLLQTVNGDVCIDRYILTKEEANSRARIQTRAREACFHVAQIMLHTYHSYDRCLNLNLCRTYACIHILCVLNLSDVT
jgi:hypothetical protein